MTPPPERNASLLGAPDTCPWCGGEAWKGVLETPRVRYRDCRCCGSLTSTTVGAVDFGELYLDHFPSGVREDSPALEMRYHEWLAAWEARVPARRILEVGCGNGHFLHVARLRGWEVRGVELSRAQVEHCRNRGLAVEYGDLVADDLFPQGGFGLVAAVEVLEHLPNPAQLLKALQARLLPGGGGHFTTPNATSLSRRLLGGRWSVFDPEHVTLATPFGLSRALGAAGFTRLRIRSRNVNPAELLQGLGRPISRGPRPDAGGRPPPVGVPGTSLGSTMTGLERTEAAGRIRDRMEASRVLRGVRWVANGILATTGTGDTLVAHAIRGREG